LPREHLARHKSQESVCGCFHDGEEIGPAALAKIAKDTGLRPEDL
jgi:predicted RNA binding protein YcfA (HicA-like mRNA interferase family)